MVVAMVRGTVMILVLAVVVGMVVAHSVPPSVFTVLTGSHTGPDEQSQDQRDHDDPRHDQVPARSRDHSVWARVMARTRWTVPVPHGIILATFLIPSLSTSGRSRL
jgi:hypothetical protein